MGEAGVGKSRLLLELKSILLQDEYAYLEGRCLQYGDSMLYLPILDILRSYLGIEEGDREFLIKKKLQEKLLQLDEQFKSHLPPLQDLLSLKIDEKAFVKLADGVEVKYVVRLSNGPDYDGWERHNFARTGPFAAQMDLAKAEVGPQKKHGDYQRQWLCALGVTGDRALPVS